MLGIFVFTTQSLVGSTLYMLNHGLSTAALFLAAGYLIKRGRSRSITDYSGVQKAAPVRRADAVRRPVHTVAARAVQLRLGVHGAGRHVQPVPGVRGGLDAIVLAALYILIMYQRTMTGPLAPSLQQIRDVTRRERSRWPRWCC